MTEHRTKLEPRCDCPTCRLARMEASVDSLRKSVDEIAATGVEPVQRVRLEKRRD